MAETTRPTESTAVGTLYVAFELGQAKWKLALTTDRGERPRHYTVEGGDLTAVFDKIARAKTQWGLPATTRVRSCYEAGRDGFWLHRCLTEHGVGNVVVDATSIEHDRRAKVVKTDRLDAERLVELLVEWAEGRKKRLRIVRVPSVAEEDGRQADRELSTAKRVRTAITNRMTGLLATQGVRLAVGHRRPVDVAAVRTWDGSPLPPALAARLARDVEELDAVRHRIAALERARHAVVIEGATLAAQQMAQLMTLVGIGANGASRLVVEFFGWRAFRNGRQLGALAGLTPAPYQSGTIRHDQGISKAGNGRVRTMAIELAWCWLRFQPQSALSRWFQQRFGRGGRRQRRIGIVALARRLLIALWRFVETGELPEGAVVTRVV